jgi:hypothetical protein
MDCSWRFWTTWALRTESPLYLTPWDEHSCAFAPIETINKQDSKKKKKKKKEITDS